MYKSFKNRTKITKRTKKRKIKGGNVKNIAKTDEGYDITYGSSIIHLPKLEHITSKNKKVSPISIFRAVGLGCTKEIFDSDDIDSAKRAFNCRFFEYKCHPSTTRTLRNIISSSVSITPLKNDDFLFKFINEIIQQSKETIVFVFGHSFGGLMINRIAEIFIKIYRYVDSEKSKTNATIKTAIKTVLEKILENVFFAGFGSVYIPSEVQEEEIPINIMNYTAVGDVSNTCTREVCHIQRVNHDVFEYSFTKVPRLNLSYLSRADSSKGFHMIDICFLDEHNNPTCTNHINNIPLLRAGNEWDIHNRYNTLINALLYKRTIDVAQLFPEE